MTDVATCTQKSQQYKIRLCALETGLRRRLFRKSCEMRRDYNDTMARICMEETKGKTRQHVDRRHQVKRTVEPQILLLPNRTKGYALNQKYIIGRKIKQVPLYNSNGSHRQLGFGGMYIMAEILLVAQSYDVAKRASQSCTRMSVSR